MRIQGRTDFIGRVWNACCIQVTEKKKGQGRQNFSVVKMFSTKHGNCVQSPGSAWSKSRTLHGML